MCCAARPPLAGSSGSRGWPHPASRMHLRPLTSEKGPRSPAALPVDLDRARIRSPCRPCRPCRRAAGRHRALLLRLLGHHRLGGDQQAGDRRRVLQRGAHHLGRVDHAAADQIAVLVGLGVEAPVGVRCSRAACRPPPPRRGRRSRRSAAPATATPCGRSRPRPAGRRWPGLTLSSALIARSSATPPPATTPSSTAARVACIASSTRSLRSLTSISVEPPTRITATPPASLASRSCSFSRS